jgi:hypothetical protein
MRICGIFLVVISVVAMPRVAFAQALDAQKQYDKAAAVSGWGGQPVKAAFDPAQMKQSQLDRIQQSLGASDDEWKALSPKVERVLAAQQASKPGPRIMTMGGGGGGTMIMISAAGPGLGGAAGPQSPVARAQADLQAVLSDPNATTDSIAARATGLRSARAKAQAELEAAQKELKELLTMRQEAVLLAQGILD